MAPCPPRCSLSPLTDPPPRQDRIISVNTMQHVHTARHLFPLFEARGQGAMLVTASAAGLLTQVGSLPYAVTKAAAVSIAEWLAISYGGKGINVSCLCPQAVESAMTAGGTGAAGRAELPRSGGVGPSQAAG